MNNGKIITSSYEMKRDILTFTHPKAALGVVVVGTGVTADADGKLRIFAGEALQGPENELWTDRQTVLQVCKGAPTGGNQVYGVTQHDIVFDAVTDEMNANCIIFGFVDPQKMDPAVQAIPDDVRDALEGKVWFIYGDRPTA